jgi:hypothetical protein
MKRLFLTTFLVLVAGLGTARAEFRQIDQTVFGMD